MSLMVRWLAVMCLGVAVPATAAMRPVSGVRASDDPADSVAASLGSLFGKSGKVRLVPLSAQRLLARTTLPKLFGIETSTADGRPRATTVAAAARPATVVPLIPFAAKQGAVLRGYRIGFWPSESRGRRARGARAAAPLPDGFIEVHAADTALAVSEQFRLGDFLTKDQRSVWPKYLVLRPQLLDKLELVSAALAAEGLPSRLRVMSGFRTPQYNAQGVGRRGGRAQDSRHMYGDAADVFVDADGNGQMDDLDGNGRITQDDARTLLAIAERVEAAHPELIGGMSAYKATSAHGPFVHIDVRGTRARW